MEDFLDSLGLYKKDVARDGSCLFRAVSEQMFFTQIHHVKIREACVEFMERNKEQFEPFVSERFDCYLKRMRNPKELAGQLEMNALAQIYKREFLIYQEIGEPPCRVTDIGSPDKVVLCCSYGSHYDNVYPKSYLTASAICQSIIYEVIYKQVFRLGEGVDIAVKKMLHDKEYSKQRRSHLLNQSFRGSCKIENERDEACGLPEDEQDAGTEIQKALAQGIPPFPYKVAKALDPQIYRNVEFDLWNELRKEQLKCEQLVTPEFAPGVKCLVRLNKDQKEPFIAYIQELGINQGPVTVYIEELCQKYTVSADSLEVLPVPAYKVLTWQGGKSYRMFGEYLKSSLPEKKGKRKYSKKVVREIPIYLPAVGQTPQDRRQSILPIQRPVCSSPCQVTPSLNVSYRSLPQQNKWKDKSQLMETMLYRSPQKKEQGMSTQKETVTQIIPKNLSPQQVSPLVSQPEMCNAQNYVQMWNGMEQVFQVPPVAMSSPPPPKTDNQQFSLASPVIGAELKECEWTAEVCSTSDTTSDVFTQPVPFFLTSMFPCDAVSCIPVSDCSPMKCDNNSSPPPASLASQIPDPQSLLAQSSEEMSPSVQRSGPAMTLYPCPVYTGVIVVYGDGSTFPMNISPWRSPEFSGNDLSSGVPGLYFSNVATPPSNMSPPMTPWIQGAAPAYGSPWSPGMTPGAASFSQPSSGDAGGYPSGYSPSWSPQPSLLLPQAPVTYPVQPAHSHMLSHRHQQILPHHHV